MKLLIFSDLHTEFPRHEKLPDLPEFDVAVAAGDIGYQPIEFLQKRFKKPVIYVPGNHEYYKSEYAHKCMEFLHKSEGTNIHVLNPGQVEIDGIHFVGATLWSSLELTGYTRPPDFMIEDAINDFRLIKDFDVETMLFLNKCERFFIERTARKDSVVVTHFVPHHKLIDPQYEGSWLNPYFTSDFPLDVRMHIFGHTHSAHDTVIDGTRYVCNPRGYPGENPPFKWKVVEL